MAIQIANTLATQRLQSLYAPKPQPAAATTSADSFSNMLNRVMDQTDATEKAAQKQADSLLTGQADNIHSVVLASEKAEVALQMTLQIRNKVLDAYNEVMRMQI